MNADSSSATPQESVIQCQALLRRLNLSTSHYLKLQNPAGAGQHRTAPGTLQSPCVDVRALLNTAAICLIPQHLAYQWWSAPAAVSHTGAVHVQSQGASAASAAANAEAVPGQVEVRGISASQVQAGNDTPSAEVTDTLVDSSSAEVRDAPEPGQHISTMDDAGLDGAAARSNDGGPFECSPVHVQLHVLRTLRQLLTVKLKAIAGGTAAEDRELAQQAGRSHAAAMALAYRAGQKEIASAALAALSSKTAQVVKTAVTRLRPGLSQPSSPEQVSPVYLLLRQSL